TIIGIEGTGKVDVLGPVRITARLHRDTGELTADVGFNAIPVSSALTQRLAAVSPALADHLRQLEGTARLQGTVAVHPGATPPLTFDVTCRLCNGSFNHACLPQPIEEIDAEFHLTNSPPSATATSGALGVLRVPE